MGDPKQKASRMMDISFNMILLVFFVFLNTIGTNDESKVKKAFGSLVGTFGIMRGGINITKGEKLLPKGPPMLDPVKESIDVSARLKQYIEERQIEDKVNMSNKRQEAIVLDFMDNLLFKPGSAELQQMGKEILGLLSPAFKETLYPVKVEGHTDNSPISSKKYPSNWELSTARAVAVVRFLVEEHDIPAEKMLARGYGEYHPLVTNDSPRNRAINRRVSIILEELR